MNENLTYDIPLRRHSPQEQMTYFLEREVKWQTAWTALAKAACEMTMPIIGRSYTEEEADDDHNKKVFAIGQAMKLKPE